MDRILKFRHNAMGIHSIGSFANIKGGVNNGCKDVYFVRALGADSNMVKDILDMDKTLGLLEVNGKGFYQRLSGLPRMASNADISFYSDCFDEWADGGKQEISIKAPACKNPDFKRILSQSCVSIEKLYGNGRQQVTGSMRKNFMIKVLFWYDFLLDKEGFFWDERLNSKIVVSNVAKEQEYLFWYAVTLTGQDVMLLQYKGDIELEKQKEELSSRFILGAYGDVQLPRYEKPEKKQEKERQTEELRESARGWGLAQDSSDTAGRGVRVVIPKHQGRRAPQGMEAPASSGMAAAPAVASHAGAGRREKTFEALARLASSVVMIAVHDNLGEVRGTGSGIMIGEKGYILTNDHVARGGHHYSVKIEEDDMVYRTDEVIKYNSVLDLAIIRIQRRLDPLPVYRGSEKLVRGQRVVAIGSPLGLFNSVSDGIISGFRTIDSVDMIQFTAPISRGSSGGAVLNMYGEVIGISTAGFDTGQNINLAMGYECINTFIEGFI